MAPATPVVQSVARRSPVPATPATVPPLPALFHETRDHREKLNDSLF